MITKLLNLRKASNTLYCILFVLMSVGAFAQQHTITNVSPTTYSSRTVVTITGTNFINGMSVKINNGANVPYTLVNANTITFKGWTTSGLLTIAKTGFTTQNGPTMTAVGAVDRPAGAAVTRMVTDYGSGSYWSSSNTSPAITPNNNHNLTGFTYGGTLYSTGVNDAVLGANAGTYTPADFRAFNIDNLPGSTPGGDTSNFLVFGKAVDGNTSDAVPTSPAIAGKRIKDVLSDGIKGLNIGTGITNADATMLMDFAVSHIDAAKINDTEPDVLISQIADPPQSSSTPVKDFFAFTDVEGNIIGRVIMNDFVGIDGVGRYAQDFFRLTRNTSFNTATVTTAGSAGDQTRPIRFIALKLSDFNITEANAASVAYFRVFPGGDMDPAFFAYNAGAITALPYITTQPISQALCLDTPQNVTFSVVAKGQGLTYQWKKAGVNITGATAASYTITNATNADVATYTVEITNIAGAVTSTTANLTNITANGAVWTGVLGSDWNTAGNWACNLVPSATVNAIIPVVGTVYPILTSGISIAKDLTIASGASVTVSGSGILEIAGNISNSGTLNVVDGTVSFIGTAAQTIPANVFETNKIKNLTINNTAGVTLSGATDLTGILTIAAGTFSTGGFITLKSDAAHTAMIAPVTGSVVGNMTIERFIPANRAFRFLTSPTTGGTIRSNWQENGVLPDSQGFGTDITGTGGAANGFDVSGSNSASMFTYLSNNPGPGTSWTAVPNTTGILTAGDAYRILIRGDRTINQASNSAPANNTTLRTTGTIVTGDHTVTGMNQTPTGFTFVGNPYQAPVDMTLALQGNALLNNNFYWVWDPNVNTSGAYVIVSLPSGTNNVSGSSANQYLQPGQAFFAQTAIAGSPTLTFSESFKHLSTTTTAVWKNAAEPAQMRFTLYDGDSFAANGKAADGFVINFDSSYSNELDTFDATKPSNQDEHMGTMNSGKVLSFESRSLPVSEDVIPVSLIRYRKTNYVYKINVNGLENVNAILLDKYTNTRTALTNNGITEVAFAIDNAIAESTAANRFDIVFENLLGVNQNAFGNAVKIYPNPATDSFNIKVPSTESTLTVKVVNAIGQNVYNQAVTAQNGLVKIQPANALKSGVYMVNISNGTSTTTQKLIIK